MHARGSAALTVGFGTAVAMWAIGYLGRLPGASLPAPLLLALLLLCLLGGGVVLGHLGKLGAREGALAGLVCGSLNLLVLGSFLAAPEPNRVRPSALWWVPGSILFAALLGAAGATLGRRWPARRRTPDWSAAFGWVAVAASLLLLGVGGIVTSTGAGLAVVDWPNSYGYNMFLYPFSRMTGGIYYEHAHRLFGALVGLTTLTLAMVLQRTERRAWVRRLGWAVVALVVIQGVLGGLRVTGRFTLSSTGPMQPSLLLAVVHGVLGQVCFAAIVALATVSAPRFRSDVPARPRAGAAIDRLLSVSLLGLLIGQLVLGAVLRHRSELLWAHVILGVAIVAPLALHSGLRSLWLNRDEPRLRWLGGGLALAVAFQVALGIASFAATRGMTPYGMEVVVTTAHQWLGAVLLGLAVSLACWNFRLIFPAAAGEHPRLEPSASPHYR